jgi:cytochrome c553
MNRLVATIVAFVAITSAHAAGDPAKAQGIVNQVCATCHGIDGNSPLSANPNLAGQHPEYLLKQLTEFKSGARSNPVMTGMVANLSPDDMSNLAAYYSSQTPKQLGAKDKDLVAQGRQLFRGGNPSNSVAACAGCHSPNGSGIRHIPGASQHADYVAALQKAFRAGDRANDLIDDACDGGQTD